MIDTTVITRQSAGKVVAYYADGADDYYAKDGTAMQWQGEGAKTLGLEGDVDPKRFRELLDGRIDENTRLRRVPFNGDGRRERLGYDLTFSAPKGISLQALVHGDHRIIEAHEKAVAAAVREAETLAMARTTINKKTSIENTGKLVVAKFRHETSREMEPDLHTHAFVMNMTQRRDGQWRALTSDGIVKATAHLGNVYKAELAKELEKAGFQLRYERNGTFDLAHFTEDQIRAFSTRSQQIEAALAEKGLTRETASTDEKNRAAMSTRKRKGKADREMLREAWQKRSAELGIDYESREWAGVGADGPERAAQRTPHPGIENPLEHYADRVAGFAIKSQTERAAIVTESALIATAIKHGLGKVGAGDVRAALARAERSGNLIREERVYTSVSQKESDKLALTRREWIEQLAQNGRSRQEATRIVDAGISQGRLQRGEVRYTTHIAQQRERAVLRMEREGRGAINPGITPEAVKRFLAEHPLTDEQGRAVTSIAQARNRFIGVQGYAGTGKSRMTLAAKELLEANGYRVTSLAPYASQKKDLEAHGMESRTVQSFLRARDKKIDDKTVVVLDEAGLVPARQMHDVMKIIEAAGARAVLLGDTEQTKAIEAGKPFDQLQKAGMETSRLTDIQRQKDPELLKAVQLAAEGQPEESVAHVSRVVEVKDPHERYATLVDEYAALSPEDREKTLIITGTNDSRKKMNEAIQESLGLRGKGQHYELLNRLDTTQAERRHSRYYEKGAVILPERDYSNGLKRGEQYTVLDTGPGNQLTVRGQEGEVIRFSPARFNRLSVYSREKTELAVGDQVRITRNDADKDLANGDRFTVKSVTQDQVLLAGKEGREITLEANKPMFAGLAYVSTIHSAQGLTSDRVLINIETKSRTTTKDVYYVGISRARHEGVIYTDNHKALSKAISRDSLKTAALELKHRKMQGRAHDQRGRERGGRDVSREAPRQKQPQIGL